MNQVVAAAILTLLFIGGNVHAKGTEIIASSLETIEEPAMIVENWMVDETYWNTANAAYVFDVASDKNLDLESWMINEKIWKNAGLNASETEVEAGLNLESWMIDATRWGKEVFNYQEKQIENGLVLEAWMTDENTWNIQ